MRIGTSYFPHINAARRYYAPYGFDNEGVYAKIKAGEIHIGKPDVKAGQRVYLNESEGRYFIEDVE